MAAEDYKKFKERINFGKYKGKEVKWVIENDPQYYKWCIDNVKNFKTSIHWKGYTFNKKDAELQIKYEKLNR